MTLPLPDIVAEEEELARVVCDSSKQKKYKNKIIYNEDDDSWDVQVSVFLDGREPKEVHSVNRISTLNLGQAHALGIQHRDDHQPDSTYHGFAKILAAICYEQDCAVEPDDLDGTKPYHANITYPNTKLEDMHEIATKLAELSEFERNPELDNPSD